MKIDFEKIVCGSAFDIAGAGSTSYAFGGTDGSPSEVRLVELKDVLYLPTVLAPGQSICLAEQKIVPVESVLNPFPVEFVKDSRRKYEEYRRTYADDFAVEAFAGKVCILGNVFSRNFGHWTEEMLKVVILEQSGSECSYVMSTLPPHARAFLLFLGIDDRRIITVDTPTVFERAIFTTPINHQNISTYPDVLHRFRELIKGRLGMGSSRYAPRLWLEREVGLNNTGITSNKEEVYEYLKKYDFDIVDMAALSIADQLRTIVGATVLAGPHGAQFVHAQFMPTGSAVIECFSPMYVNPSIFQICRALNHSYRQIVSRCSMLEPYSRGRDCEVDCEHLALVLDSL